MLQGVLFGGEQGGEGVGEGVGAGQYQKKLWTALLQTLYIHVQVSHQNES